MIELDQKKNHYDQISISKYLKKKIFKNLDDENDYESIDAEKFNIDFFIQNINNFNSAVDKNESSLIMNSVDEIIDQLVPSKDTGIDIELNQLPRFQYSIFYSKCIQCLYLNFGQLDLKILHLFCLLTNLSTDVSCSLIENDVFTNIVKYFMNQALSSEYILAFFYLISQVSLSSYDARVLLVELGILYFFNTILNSCRNFDVYYTDLYCIYSFFSYELFDIDVTQSPHFDELLLNLKQIVEKILSKKVDLDFDESEYIRILLLTISIFNAYVGADRYFNENTNETCAHFFDLDIPSSFVNFFDSNWPKDIISEVFSEPILSNINQLLKYEIKKADNSFSSNLNVLSFADLCQVEEQRIQLKSLSIIEKLITLCPNNISKLLEVKFYDYLPILLENSKFVIQEQVINILLATVIYSTSSEITQYFANENIVDYFVEYINIPVFEKSKQIPDALNKINELISQDNNPLSEKIHQALDDLCFSSS